jgi:hypothetical protein
MWSFLCEITRRPAALPVAQAYLLSAFDNTAALFPE